MEKVPATAVIIVTHDSALVLHQCLASLAGQSLLPSQVLVLDSGSAATGYLDDLPPPVRAVRLRENIGFSRANNEGFLKVDGAVEYLLFLNPDVLLQPDALALGVRALEEEQGVGCLTGRLLGYDFARQQPSGLLDSTGIFRKWYGRWYDRGQGEPDRGQYVLTEDVPAACGALLLCRRKALTETMLQGGAVFDPDFFLYKEDIELCLRLRKKGWRIRYDPAVRAWHGRGWRNRREMSFALRRMAAGSELTLYRKHPSPYLLWALLKYLLVRLLKV
jgi:N-acetylglucosaminyl-diphospho-decaprenol L-rhamnosyltransferase